MVSTLNIFILQLYFKDKLVTAELELFIQSHSIPLMHITFAKRNDEIMC